MSAATRENLLRIGRERALIYKTLVLTGLRKGELASITVDRVDLGGRVPHLLLNARDEKNRRGSEIPLRADLAADIHSWLADRLARDQQAARDADEPILAALPSDEPLFEVPDGLIRIFDRDLVFAGLARIEKRGGKDAVIKTDDRGRTIDTHALRHTLGTHLSKAGVPLRTAQAAIREIAAKGTAARFKKHERGVFVAGNCPHREWEQFAAIRRADYPRGSLHARPHPRCHMLWSNSSPCSCSSLRAWSRLLPGGWFASRFKTAGRTNRTDTRCAGTATPCSATTESSLMPATSTVTAPSVRSPIRMTSAAATSTCSCPTLSSCRAIRVATTPIFAMRSCRFCSLLSLLGTLNLRSRSLSGSSRRTSA
ncbi:MAG: site-specific integrase [Phycisphaerales bacterium]|nr:site-specific integrase [Phycisphaerales bacterium]